MGAAVNVDIGNSPVTGTAVAQYGTKWNHLGVHHGDATPVDVGIMVDTSDFIGHVALVAIYSDGTYEQADYGRYTVILHSATDVNNNGHIVGGQIGVQAGNTINN